MSAVTTPVQEGDDGSGGAANPDNFSERDSVADPKLGLYVNCYRSYLSPQEQKEWWGLILDNTDWFRVKYCSSRYANNCTTPCYTNFFGGVPGLTPYQPIPPYLQPLVDRVSKTCGAPFNSFLLRLYIDGNDTIAWHTDGRTFLGPTPVIASLSLGAPAKFEMRRMTNVWPCTTTPNGGIDKDVPQRKWTAESGDMLVMLGTTQQHWHHRVPQEKYRRPRVNLNFRYILPNDPESQRGQQTFFKYMVCGDEHDANWNVTAPSWKYADIIKQQQQMASGGNKEMNIISLLTKLKKGNGNHINSGETEAKEEVSSQLEQTAKAYVEPEQVLNTTSPLTSDMSTSTSSTSPAVSNGEAGPLGKKQKTESKGLLHFFAGSPSSTNSSSNTSGINSNANNSTTSTSNTTTIIDIEHKEVSEDKSIGCPSAKESDDLILSSVPIVAAASACGSWSCSVCTFDHVGREKQSYLACEVCGTPRE